MIGWGGLGLLVFAYVILISSYSKWFIPIDIAASLLLTIHAIIIRDIPFLIVNGFISILLTIKLIKREEIF